MFAAFDVRCTRTELRPPQADALSELTRPHAEDDIVLKISTGARETTIGLLYLHSHMRISKEVSVYLCPTVQLVAG